MELTELQQRQLDILNWERENRNINNRADSSLYGCVYTHKNHGGCAVGRLIPAELADKLTGQVFNCFCKLPPKVQELGVTFLTAIQNLHDSSTHWNENGLSYDGDEYAKYIEQNILNNNY